MTSVEDNDDDDAVLGAASDILESATANTLIEMQFNKAVRVGTLLRLWRDLMLKRDENVGQEFPVEWVDRAAMDLFHTFFPPPETEQHGQDDD